MKQTLEEWIKLEMIENAVFREDSKGRTSFKIGLTKMWELIHKVQEIEMKKEWYDEDKTDKRMNVIGQNGNSGEHYGKERMYSEEDLKEAFKRSRQAFIFEKDMPPIYETFEDWFKQFKNK